MKKKVLFLCVANSARSQMAEGLARSIISDEFEVQSAGSQASGYVHPLAFRALQEIGIDHSQARSKSIEDLDLQFSAAVDYVITLCAEEVCPVWLSPAKKLHWPMQDPAAQASPEVQWVAFQQVRDMIRLKLLEFKAT